MQSDYAALYAQLYREHWWWRAREAIVLNTLRRLGRRPGSGLDILDVGCGDGLFFPALSALGTVRGIEIDDGLLDPDGPYRNRISTRPLGDPMYKNPSWRFDLILALDVLEHLDDDRDAVAAMTTMLRPGGLLIVTVPAFALLWDHHDEINHHRRRYSAGRLRRLLSGHDLELLRLRYLFRALFIPKLMVRLINAGRHRKITQHAIPSSPWNAMARRICLLEDYLLHRLPVPFGTSVLAVARRAQLPKPRVESYNLLGTARMKANCDHRRSSLR